MELEEEQYEDMQSSEEQYEDMQSPVRQYQGAYCEVVKTTPRRQVSSSIKKQDSLGAPPLPPRTHDVTEGGILVLDPPPHFKIANQPKQTETPPPLYEYLPESEADRASELQLSMRTLPILPSVYDDQPKLDTNFKCPIGYDIMSLLSQGNVIFIMPKTSVKRQPLYINHTLGGYSERIVQGGGAFTDESKFMVSIPRAHKSELMITLESLKYKGRYLCIDRRGRIKARNGYKDSCDFFVYGVSGSPHLVYFESARSDGFYFGMRSDNSPSDAASITADSEEAHFGILTDNISESFRAPKLTVFGTNSIMEQVRDKSVIRLFSQRRYLGIDRKGRVVQTHNDKNTDSWFVVHDRGMGILSLRSYAHTEYWLKIQDGQPQRKGKPGLDTFFKLRESVEHQIILESIAQPGTYIFPTSRNTLSMSPTGTSPSMTPEFTLEIISEKQS